MQALLEWGQDWILRPRFHIPPTWFLDHCEMTIANINDTSVVETKFQKQMQDSLRASPKTLVPRAKENGSRIVASTASRYAYRYGESSSNRIFMCTVSRGGHLALSIPHFLSFTHDNMVYLRSFMGMEGSVIKLISTYNKRQ